MRSFLAARYGALVSFIGFLFACAPEPALAQSTGSSINAAVLPLLLNIALSPMVWACAGSLLVLLVARKSTARAAQIQKGIVWAFHIVEDLKQLGQLPPGVDKAVLALEKLEALLTTQGISLTDAEKALAEAVWSAMHGAAPKPAAVQSLGFARVGLLTGMAALCLCLFAIASCALFKSTLVKDLEIDCGEPALAAAAAVLLPDVLNWAKGTAVDWQAQLAKLEAPGEEAALCAAATGVADFDPNGATAPASPDAGAPPPLIAEPSPSPVPAVALAAHPSGAAATLWVNQARPSTNLVIAANLRTYLAGHTKKPVLRRG